MPGRCRIAHTFYNQPMSPEIEQEIAWVKTKYGKLKLALLDDFDFQLEVYDRLGDGEEGRGAMELHALAQRAAAAMGRVAQVSRADDLVDRVL